MIPNRSSRTYRARTRVTPPAAQWAETEGIDGLGSMLELQGEQGFLTWRALRNVRLWAATPRESRRGLFVEGAYEQRLAEILSLHLERDVFDSFAALAEVLRSPHSMDPRVVAVACGNLARWADAQGMRITTLELLHAAALACPDDPYFALAAGREARDQARHDLADAWLTRSVVLARQSRDWELYTRAHVAIGNMLTTRGSFPRARHHLQRAMRRAQRERLSAVLGNAHHNLLGLEMHCENFALAHEHAVQALRAFPAGHPDTVNLAFDTGYLWLYQGHFAAAYRVFRTVAPLVPARFLPNLLGGIARAAGAEGCVDEFVRARESLSRLDAGARSGAIWYNVALGGISLRRWDEAEEDARLAERIGRERRESGTILLAEELLQQIRQRRPGTPGTVRAPDAPAVADAVEEFVSALAAFAV